MPKPPESHYDINKLHLVFAIVTGALLLSTIGMFMQDYDRTWKDYQKDFRNYEIEKTRVKYDLVENKLTNDEEYKALAQEIEKSKKSIVNKCPDLAAIQKDIHEWTVESELATKQYQFKKAELDAARYRLEEAMEHKTAELPDIKEEYAGLDKTTKQLNQQIEDYKQKITEKTRRLDSCNEQIKKLEGKERNLEKQSAILKRKLKKIDPNEMSFVNKMGDLIRDLPVIDLSNPNEKIQQIVLNDILDDVNFMQVPKVERCTSCHLGIDNPDYQNAPQPFKTHPNLDLILGKNSPHPLEEIGCTVCHGGRGRGTSFLTSVHTPASEEQAENWKKKYDWHPDHEWEEPMLPMPYVEAGCFKCHSNDTVIKGAEKLNLGLNLIEKTGCYNCHAIKKYEGWPKTGPDLTHVASKMSKEWSYKWIENPKSFRSDTWMPSFYNLSNNNDPNSQKRSEQEILAMVHYLFSQSQEYKTEPMSGTGDAKKGEEIVTSLGCLACHQLSPERGKMPTTRQSLLREHGPNLTGLGSKTSPEWIYNWLKDPARYHPETRMPNLRLTDEEARDAAAYLSEGKNADFDKKSVAKINDNILSEIVFDFLSKSETAKIAKQKITSMDRATKLSYAGEKLIGHYGCFACHNIKGFESARPVGTELTEEGSKPANKLDFGFISIEHSNHAWFTRKLQDPRIFDRGKIKTSDEKLKMPHFNLSDQEIEAVTTVLLGFTKDITVKNKQDSKTPEKLAMEEGEKIVRQMNCQGCHLIEGEGGAIQPSVKEWLMKFGNHSDTEAQGMVTSFSPPNLIGEGKKVQTEWLFEFLHQPTDIRPWLKVRMPTYKFNAAHLNALVKYFSALDHEAFPFTDKVDVSMSDEEFASAEKLFSNSYFGCAQCHIVGDKMPSGSPDSWAPNFAIAKTRLKPEWIIKWLVNPQDLLPGTKMPTYFDPNSFDKSGPEDILNGDEHEQIRILRNYLLTISNVHPVTDQATETIAPPAPTPEAIPPDGNQK